MTPDGDITYSPNSAIDAAIKEMLPNFDSASQGRMRKAILNAKRATEKHCDENADAGARHIFREFIPAYTLNQNGFAFEYEKPIQGKTPDWLDDTALLMLESYTYERGGSSNFFDRVKSSVTSKCYKYNDIVVANDFHFVVAVYIDFLTGMTLEECRENSEEFRHLFNDNESLWAVVFFTETQVINSKQQYGFFCLSANSSFKDIPNWPFATMSMER